MTIQEAIISRRSIRKFTNQSVSDETVKALLQAAMYAPSARNQQPWHFIVLNEREILSKIPSVHPYSQMLNHAPLAILVCADERVEVSPGYWVQDCSAATQNILLSATGMGLGSVWLGIYPRVERIMGFRKLFNLPEHVHPLSIIALGYPDEQIAQPERMNEDRIHYNCW